MGQYTNKGLYNRYDKNHKERDKLDYYATKPGETLNILNQLNIDFNNSTILEPACGGGHMALDIIKYLKANKFNTQLICSDVAEHKSIFEFSKKVGLDYDFLSDNYPFFDGIDWIIMNPPFATIEPFTIRALEIADRGVIMFARLQFLEGSGRYENILKDNPPSDVYVYVDRIQCWKDGVEPSGSSAQAYAWFVWDKTANNKDSKLHWIRRT